MVNSPRGRNTAVLLILLLIVAALVIQFLSSQTQAEPYYFNQLAEAIRRGDVKRVIVDENELEVVFANGDRRLTRKEPTATAIEHPLGLGVTPQHLGSAA